MKHEKGLPLEEWLGYIMLFMKKFQQQLSKKYKGHPLSTHAKFSEKLRFITPCVSGG